MGTLRSLASAFRPVVISVSSCTRLSRLRFRAGQQLQIIDDEHVEAALALQPARARGELRDRNAAGLVDVERDRLHLEHRLRDEMELVLGDVAAADLVGGHAGLFGDDARRQLFRRHFEREEADDAAVDGLHRAVGLDLAAIGLGDVEGDVGGERGLAHAGAAGDDDQVGGLQAAHLVVEIVHAGRDAAEMPVALIGLGGHVDGESSARRRNFWKPPP